MIDVGAGPAVVLIPGIQGRWEWMRPAVDALSARCRVISFSLPGEPGSGEPSATPSGFERFAAQIDRALDRAGLDAATICGVSFGGLIALHYAAHRPDRTAGLVLVSTPFPAWQPDCRVRNYLRAPRLLSPLFVARTPGRLWPEIAEALPRWRPRLAFTVGHLGRIAAAPFSPTLMAERARLWLEADHLARACDRVSAPTLVVTGEAHLDRVVPVASSRQYLARIGGAQWAAIERTGHIGLITRSDRFADLVGGFAARNGPPAREAVSTSPAPASGHDADRSGSSESASLAAAVRQGGGP